MRTAVVIALVALAGCGGGGSGEASGGFVFGSLGGQLTAVDAVLTIPPGALNGFLSLTLSRIPGCGYDLTQTPDPGTCSGDSAGFGTIAGAVVFVGSPGVISGNPYELSPGDVSFGTPGTLELSTKDMLLTSVDVVPDPSHLERLRIGTVVNGRWQAVSGSTFDAPAQVVRGNITGGGRYAITQICADGTIGNCT